MFTDYFTKLLQGATFQRFWAMIKGIPESTPDVEMRCLRAMAKVTTQECVGNNDRNTHETATVIRGSCRGMCTDARGGTCTGKYTHKSTNKYACESTCTDARGSM